MGTSCRSGEEADHDPGDRDDQGEDDDGRDETLGKHGPTPCRRRGDENKSVHPPGEEMSPGRV
jgi:hypothetical protein